jgi:hypothetical protein
MASCYNNDRIKRSPKQTLKSDVTNQSSESPGSCLLSLAIPEVLRVYESTKQNATNN